MAINLDAVRQKLSQLQNVTTKQNNLWKPEPGAQQIRIVPYQHNRENPFLELYFHYNSPMSFGRPDPIVEFATKLKKSGDKEEWKKGRSLEPKMRTYVPILVRGEEHEGVKFWGMGKQVYQEILGLIADPDYGDITDVKNGRDLTIEFKTAQECGKDFPETTVRPHGSASPAFDPADKALLEKVKNQKNVTELWPELSYDELAAVMDTWLNAPASTDADPETNETPSEDSAPAAAAPVSATQKVAAVKTPATSAKDIAAEFDDLFNK